jgi:hypothetical protein
MFDRMYVSLIICGFADFMPAIPRKLNNEYNTFMLKTSYFYLIFNTKISITAPKGPKQGILLLRLILNIFKLKISYR